MAEMFMFKREFEIDALREEELIEVSSASDTTSDIQFTADEIKERSRLFQREFDQEELHDRVLVVQIMPDDYELQEWQGHLEVYENGHETEEVRETVFDISKRYRNQEEYFSEKPCPSYSDMSCGYSYKKDCRENLSECTGEVSVVGSDRKVGKIIADEEENESGSGVETAISSRKTSDAEKHVVCSDEIAISRSPSHAIIETSNDLADMREADCESFTYSGSRDTFYVRAEIEEASFVETECAKHCNLQENESGSVFAYDDAPNNGVSDSETGAYGYGESNTVTSSLIGPPSENSQNSRNCGTFSVNEELNEVAFPETEKSEHVNLLQEDSETGSEDDAARGVHVLRERRFFVHGCWLAVNSRYFRSLLYASGMKESSSKEFTMKVTESEETAFVVFLESIYNPAALDDIDVNTLLNVLRFSVKYDVKFSFRKAKRVLQATPLTLDVCEIIIDAKSRGGMSDIDDVMENVEGFLFLEFTPLDETWESDKFASLSRGALQVLLASDMLGVQSENTIFVALMRWIAKHSEIYGNLAECSDLLSLVRFELMKSTYLNDVVRNHEVVTQLDNFAETYLAAMTYHALPKKRRAQDMQEIQRNWCEAKTPTYMWILDPDEEMFVFDVHSINSRKSSSFWYFGYKMHLRLQLSPRKGATRLSLVVENMAEDGSVKLAYNVDVKFSDGLHKSYTCAPFEYRGLRPSRGENPFDKKYSLEEIKEILLGSSVKVTIIFEISVEKLVDD